MALTDAGLAFHALRGYQIGDWIMTRPYGAEANWPVEGYVKGQIVSQEQQTHGAEQPFWGIVIANFNGVVARVEDEMVPCER